MRKILLSPIWSILLLGLLSWLYVLNPNLLETIRLRYFDTLIINQPLIDNNIYTVNLDQASIDKNGQWPFPRSVYSDIIVDLFERGAGIVVFNVLMSEVDRSGEDFNLVVTLNELPVILPLLGAPTDKNIATNPGATIINPNFLDRVPNVPGIIANVPGIQESASGSGITNAWPEIDGVTRRIPLVVASNGVLYPNITMEVLRVIVGDPSFQIKLNELGVDKLRIPQFGQIQTSSTGEVWIDWSQKYKSHNLDNLPNDFKGGIVFVGPTAPGVTQPLATAKGSIFPHEIQAVLLGTVFNESNIARHPDAEQWAEFAAFVLAGIFLILIARWTYVGIAFFVLSLGGSIGISWYAFTQYGLLVDGFIPATFLLLVGLARYIIKFLDEFLQKQEIKKQFAGYASPTVVRMLQENPALIKEGMKREVSICFSDLRGFTPLGESFGDDVKGLTKIMNGYMDAITQPVLDMNGMIIKYIGDASMHIHNAPIDDSEHPHTAVHCGLEMLKAVEKFNEKLEKDGRPRVGMGAGINTGLGYLGEMGSTQRHSYDVLGDSVSTAARIESKCKEYGCVLLIGENTYERTKDDFFYLKVDDLAVKGKSVGIGIWTVLDDTKPAYKTSQKYHAQMHKEYKKKNFDEAIRLCEQLHSNFDGKMENYYTMWKERCEYMKTQDLPADWNGVFIATTK